MSVNFVNLENISLGDEPRHCAVNGERLACKQLFKAVQLLGGHDPLNTNFTNCCIYASRYNPIEEGTQRSEVEAFLQSRAQYLKNLLIYAREFFPGDQHAEQKLFTLSQKTLRAIDPALIGETRYDDADCLLYKVYKAIVHFFWGQVYMWGARDQIRMWAARYDILKWGASQDPEIVLKPPLQILGLGQFVNGFEVKNIRDQIIAQICYKELKFTTEELKVLQILSKLIPGKIEQYMYHPSDGNFHLVLENKWEGKISDEELNKKILEELGSRSGLKVDPHQIRILLKKTIEGKVIQRDSRIELRPQAIQVVIPSNFGGKIYISVIAIERDECGRLHFTIRIDGENRFVNFAIQKLVMVNIENWKIPHPISLPDEEKALKLNSVVEYTQAP